MKKIILFTGIFIIIAILVIIFINNKHKFIRIESNDKEGIRSELLLKEREDIICMAVAPVISPKSSIILYAKLKDYISSKLNKKVELIYRETYKEINELIFENLCDIAFVCTGAYVKDLMNAGVQILVIPNVNGKITYNSYIITNIKNNINRFEDLKNKKFAFTDPLSLSGFLYVKYRLKKSNQSMEKFFNEIMFTKSHDNSIKAVVENIVDAACVDSLVYILELKNKKDLAEKIKIIEKSPDFGIPPVVVKNDMDNKLKIRLKNVLLNMHKDEQGKKVLELLDITKFEEPQLDNYYKIKEIITSN